MCLTRVRQAQRQRRVQWSESKGEARPPRDMELALGGATGRTNARKCDLLLPSIPSTAVWDIVDA